MADDYTQFLLFAIVIVVILMIVIFADKIYTKNDTKIENSESKTEEPAPASASEKPEQPVENMNSGSDMRRLFLEKKINEF